MSDETNLPKLQRAASVLQVNSRTVRAMRDFFVERLGFEVGIEVGTSPNFVTLDRDGQTIMLACRWSFGFRQGGWAAFVAVAPDGREIMFGQILAE
ncbi:MAG: hypothetical protein ACR2PG_20100 [Hyphomicrobiaceae bacterium]